MPGCAEIGAPPGGPVDRSGPFILSSEPVNGSLDAPSSDRVTIYFSENVIKPTSGRAVFISPRPSGEITLEWKSDQLTVILPDSFRINQTYVITLSNTVTDLRRNPMDSSAGIAFSTGSKLDTGVVAGRVLEHGRSVGGVQVALYDPSSLYDSVQYDSLYPDYVVSATREGRFRFRNLPDREFRVVAFVDKDRNERLDPFAEPFAVADRRVVVGGELPVNSLILPLQKKDSSQLTIRSVNVGGDGLLKVRISKPLAIDLLPSGAFLVPVDSIEPAVSAIGMAESGRSQATVLNLYFGSIPPAEYSLRLDWSVEHPTITSEPFSIGSIADSRAPSLVRFTPELSPVFLDEAEISFRFSEPIDGSLLNRQTFTLWKDDSSAVPIEILRPDPFEVTLVPNELKNGEAYRLDLTEFDIVDLAGNSLGDSLARFSFAVFDPDSLGTISGEIAVSLASRVEDRAIVSFLRTEDQRVFDLPVSGKSFTISVPPGKYLLSGFLDSDFDSQRGEGSLIPFAFSETVTEYPDTISVRARFETAGITLEFK